MAPAALSPGEVLRSFFMEIETKPDRIEALVNHPSIYPHVKGAVDGRISMASRFTEPGHVVLVGPNGGVIFDRLLPGLWEMHSAVLPESRGSTMLEGARQAFHIMFSRTDCIEIVTKCPDGNLAAKTGARAVGMSFAWTIPEHYPPEMRDTDVYSLRVEPWAQRAPYCEPVGRWFHRRIAEEYARLGHDLAPHSHDPLHDFITGAAVAMIQGGQVMNGQSVYNRWSAITGFPPVVITAANPLTFDLGECTVRAKPDDFEVIECR
jgi:hypothetical protein